MSTNEEKFVLPYVFDTCDIMYNSSISHLPPIVLYNLFGLEDIIHKREEFNLYHYLNVDYSNTTKEKH